MSDSKNKIKSIPSEQFEKLIKSSKSFTEVCRTIGVDGRHRKIIKNMCLKNNINYSHFTKVHIEANDESIKKIIANSKSISDASRKSNRGRKYINSIIKKLNINTDHFTINANKKSKTHITDEKLISIGNDSSNLTDMLSKLKLPETNESYLWLRGKLKKLNFNLGQSPRINWRGDVNDINVKLKNRKYGPYIGRNLVKYGIKENKCDECGIPPEWNGKKLRLECHHVNGDREDNDISNLQILCPNCHTQTENHSISKL